MYIDRNAPSLGHTCISNLILVEKWWRRGGGGMATGKMPIP